MTEDDLLRAVLELCLYRNCHAHHSRPARTVNGWRTAIQGNPGFPDLVIVGTRGVLWRELKAPRGRVTPEQARWIAQLQRAGADADIWRPCHLTSGRITAEIGAIA